MLPGKHNDGRNGEHFTLISWTVVKGRYNRRLYCISMQLENHHKVEMLQGEQMAVSLGWPLGGVDHPVLGSGAFRRPRRLHEAGTSVVRRGIP